MMRTPHPAGAPVFNRLKQTSSDALIPVPAAYRDLSNMAIDHFSVHCIRRLFKAGVYESNDLAAEFCDKRHNLPTRVRRMLPTLSVARRYRLSCGYQIAFRIKLGMIFSTFEKRAGDAASIFWNSRTDLNCRGVTVFTHDDAREPTSAKSPGVHLLPAIVITVSPPKIPVNVNNS